jgi:hypothetical protein
MSSIHHQAMGHVHHQLLERMLGYFTQAQRAALRLLIQRLTVAAGGSGALGQYTIMLACGGGKDSLQTLAFLRAAQLSISQRSPVTFRLRVATCRHAGLTSAAFANVQRACSALFLRDDPRIELLLVDERQVSPLAEDMPTSEVARATCRINMLMSGHLTAGDERVTFGNGCYQTLVDFYQSALGHGEGVHAVAIAGPPTELRHHLSWGLRGAGQTSHRQPLAGDLLDALVQLGDAGQRPLRGEPSATAQHQPSTARGALKVINLHGLLDSDSLDHWPLLTDFLGFQWLGQGTGFNELDCISPLLLAHLRGLRAQWLQGHAYQRGVQDYLRLAVPLMRSRGTPESLVRQTLATWHGQAALDQRREEANRQAAQTYGVGEAQLVCLLFSPFAEHGVGLRAYLHQCHPTMLPQLAALHGTLQGLPSKPALRRWLKEVSGLSTVALQRLYRLRKIDLDGDRLLVSAVNVSDPRRHQRAPVVPLTGHTLRTLIAGQP